MILFSSCPRVGPDMVLVPEKIRLPDWMQNTRERFRTIGGVWMCLGSEAAASPDVKQVIRDCKRWHDLRREAKGK